MLNALSVPMGPLAFAWRAWWAIHSQEANVILVCVLQETHVQVDHRHVKMEDASTHATTKFVASMQDVIQIPENASVLKDLSETRAWFVCPQLDPLFVLLDVAPIVIVLMEHQTSVFVI